MPVFVDSNVLVYARDRSEPEKQVRAAAWMERLWRAHEGRVSVQVLQEFYVTVTQKLRPGMPRPEARQEVDRFRAWRPLAVDLSLLDGAWRVQDRHRVSFWDALVVSAAKRAVCDTLLTEDLQDGQDFDGLRVVNPFTHDP